MVDERAQQIAKIFRDHRIPAIQSSLLDGQAQREEEVNWRRAQCKAIQEREAGMREGR